MPVPLAGQPLPETVTELPEAAVAGEMAMVAW
jgi:hypothetical protein